MLTLISLGVLSLSIIMTSCSVDVGLNDPGDAKNLKKMTFKAPDLTEEDSHSLFVPAEFKCDACLIVAYQVNNLHVKGRTCINLL